MDKVTLKKPLESESTAFPEFHYYYYLENDMGFLSESLTVGSCCVLLRKIEVTHSRLVEKFLLLCEGI